MGRLSGGFTTTGYSRMAAPRQNWRHFFLEREGPSDAAGTPVRTKNQQSVPDWQAEKGPPDSFME
jgi:hypothetical protein